MSFFYLFLYNLPLLGAGNYTITIANAENQNYTGAVKQANFTVDKAGSSVSVDVMNVTYPDKASVTIAVVNATVVTYVVKSVDGTVVVQNTTWTSGSFDLDLGAGNYTILIDNAENQNISGSGASANFTVYKYAPVIEVTSSDVRYGEDVKVTVKADVSGDYTVKVGNASQTVSLTAGVAQNVTFAGLEVNEDGYIINVTYNETENYTYAVNDTEKVRVNRIDEPMDIDINKPVYGDDAVLVIELPEDAKGNVTVEYNGVNYTAPVENGTATLKIPNLPVGDTNVDVMYSGDSKYSPKVIPKTIHVKKIIIVANNIARGWNSGMDYQARLVDEDGIPISGKTLTFTVNGNTYTASTDSNGFASINPVLPVGAYDVGVDYPGADNAAGHVDIVKRILENSDLTMDYKDGHSYTVRAIGDDGNPVGAGVTVHIKINGVDYAIKTDKDGYASLPINLIPKKYVATASYWNTEVKNNVAVKQILKLVKKTVKVKKSAKKLVLKAKLKHTNGKAIKGKVIKFKFRGKTYKAKTNKKGIAKVTIKKKVIKKLKKGKKYTYSARYIKDIVKGKVKVKK